MDNTILNAKIYINRLRSDELTYELLVRGVELGSGKVDEKRFLLREALLKEREGRLPEFRMRFDPINELSICANKIEELDGEIQTFDINNRENEKQKLEARLLHVQQRLDRIISDNSTIVSRKVSFLKAIEEARKNLETVYAVAVISNANATVNANHSILDEPNHLLPSVMTSSAPTVVPAYVNADANESPIEDLLQFVDLSDSKKILESQNEQTVIGTNANMESKCNVEITSNPSFGHSLLSHPYNFDLQSRSPSFAPPLDVNNLVDRFKEINCNSTVNPEIIESRIATYGDSRALSLSNYAPTVINDIPEFTQSYGPRNVDVQHHLFPSRKTQNFPTTDRRSQNVFYPEYRSQNFSHPTHFQESYNTPKFVDVSRWRLKFNGTTSVTDFLDKLEEMRISRNVSKKQMFDSVSELLEADASIWFRFAKSQIVDYDDFIKQMRCTFLPKNYEERIWDMLKRRTQGPTESVPIYVAYMENLFAKLTSKPCEATRVSFIRGKMLPHIQMSYAGKSIITLALLITIGREIEEISLSAQEYRAPFLAPRNSVEPGLEFQRPTTSRISTLEPELNVLPSEIIPSVNIQNTLPNPPQYLSDISVYPLKSTPSSVRCWNCGQNGHVRVNCTQPPRKHCFKCGVPGVTVKTCNNCSGNFRQSH